MGRFGMISFMDWALPGWGYGPSPFYVDVGWPLSGWGYGLAPFPHLLFPSSPSLMRFRATRCIYVYFETSTVSWVHGDTFSVSAAENQFLPLMSSDLFCFCYGVEYWGQGVLHQVCRVVGLLHNGHVELGYDPGGVCVVNHRCPLDSISFGIVSSTIPINSHN